MKKEILEILIKINLDKEYLQLCTEYCDFNNSANFKRKDVEPIIKSYDSDFKYISGDKTFLKEFLYEEFTVRFFIDFSYGIAGFGYLVWKEGENQNYYKGNLVTLTELIDPRFEEKVKHKSPIATSAKEYDIILSKIFKLYNDFKLEFEKIKIS